MRYEDALQKVKGVLGVEADWEVLDDGARHRIMWIARRVADGELDLERVSQAWEKSRLLPYSLRGRISAWFSELS